MWIGSIHDQPARRLKEGVVPIAMKIGHAHLKVRDLDRSVEFYQRFLGLRVRERIGNRYAFMSGSDAHHDLAIQGIGREAPGPHATSTGLYHVAFELPDRRALAEHYKRLVDAGVAVVAVDHRISWAIYFSDPDDNGLELYWDSRRESEGADLWEGHDRPLTRERLLAELDGSD